MTPPPPPPKDCHGHPQAGSCRSWHHFLTTRTQPLHGFILLLSLWTFHITHLRLPLPKGELSPANSSLGDLIYWLIANTHRGSNFLNQDNLTISLSERNDDDTKTPWKSAQKGFIIFISRPQMLISPSLHTDKSWAKRRKKREKQMNGKYLSHWNHLISL